MSDIKVCSFTGYRPYRFGFTSDGLRPEQVQQALAQQIRKLCDLGCRTYISGLCIGVDLWAAEAVLQLQADHPEVELVGAVPFDGQELYWTIAERREYTRVRDACIRVEVLSAAPGPDGDAAACYRLRNRWMVEQADTLLAVYSQDTADRRSGTAATVRYARQLQRRIVYIHPQTLATAEEEYHQIRFSI